LLGGNSSSNNQQQQPQQPQAQTQTTTATRGREGDFEWRLNQYRDNEMTINRYFGSESTVVYPSVIQGMPVRHVNGWSDNNITATSVVIPEGVTSISGFNGYANLSSVTLPSTLTQIANFTFSKTPSLRNITLPAGLKAIGEGAFMESGITSINIPAVEIFLKNVFENSKLRSIVIAEGVTEMGGGAFTRCSDLTSVTLPSTIRIMGDNPFAVCPSLTTINIPESVKEIIFYDTPLHYIFNNAPNLNAQSRAALQRVHKNQASPAMGGGG
jgi:hypothetical protein